MRRSKREELPNNNGTTTNSRRSMASSSSVLPPTRQLPSSSQVPQQIHPPQPQRRQYLQDDGQHEGNDDEIITTTVTTINSAGIVTSYQTSSSSSSESSSNDPSVIIHGIQVQHHEEEDVIAFGNDDAPSYHSSSSSSSDQSSSRKIRSRPRRNQTGRETPQQNQPPQSDVNINFSNSYSDAPSYHSSSDDDDDDEHHDDDALQTNNHSNKYDETIYRYTDGFADAPSYHSTSSSEDEDDENDDEGNPQQHYNRSSLSSRRLRMGSITTTSSSKSGGGGHHSIAGFSAAPSYHSDSSSDDDDDDENNVHREDHDNHANSDHHGAQVGGDGATATATTDEEVADDREIPTRQSSVFVGAVAIYPQGNHSDSDEDDFTMFDNLEVGEGHPEDGENGMRLSSTSSRRKSTRRSSSSRRRVSRSINSSSVFRESELSSENASRKSSFSMSSSILVGGTSTISKTRSLLSSLFSSSDSGRGGDGSMPNNVDGGETNNGDSSTRPNSLSSRKHRAAYRLMAIAVLVFILGGGIALFVTRRNESPSSSENLDDPTLIESSDDSSTPSPTVTMSPTLTRYDFFYQLVQPISRLDDEDNGSDNFGLLSSEAAYQALDWLVYNDSRIMDYYYYDPNNVNNRNSNDVDSFFGRSFLLERYALAVFYFSTNGPTSWKSQLNFLNTELTTCKWNISITCDEHRHVTSLDIVNNNLNGTIPKELTALSYLETLKLANNPNLQGTLPFSFFFSEGVSSSLLPTEPQYPLSSNLKDLDLSHTALSGTLPSTMLDNLDELEKIDLSYSRLSGNMLDRMFRLSSLRVLNLQNNTFEGTIPEFKTIGGSTPMELQECWLDNNQLIGRVPSSLYDTATNLSVLSLSENFLSGTLPGRKITKLSHLRVLNVDDNLFRGKIPTEIGVLDSLRRFSMHFNILSGAIPSEVGRLSQLRYLNVGKNNLNGLLPNELSNLSSLAWLSVQDNQLIEGTLPSGLSTLSTLRSLDIRHTGIADTMDAFCDRLASGTLYTTISADCGGSSPTVVCPCCTQCCDSIQRLCTNDLDLNCQIEAGRYQHEENDLEGNGIPSRETTCACDEDGHLLSCSDSPDGCQSCNSDGTICAVNDDYEVRFDDSGNPISYNATFEYVVGRDDKVSLFHNIAEDVCTVTIKNDDDDDEQECTRCAFVSCQNGITHLDIECDNIDGVGNLNLCADEVEGGALSIFEQIDPQYQSGCPPRFRLDDF